MKMHGVNKPPYNTTRGAARLTVHNSPSPKPTESSGTSIPRPDRRQKPAVRRPSEESGLEGWLRCLTAPPQRFPDNIVGMRFPRTIAD